MILSKTGSLYQQPNLFHFFLSTSSVLEHELKTHISDVLKTVYLLLMQIGCFHIYKNFFQSCNKSHLAVQIWCGKRDNHFSRRKTGEHGVKRLTAKNKNWCQIGVKTEKSQFQKK